MAYWPGNVKNYRGHEEVEFACRYCQKTFHSQVILDGHENKCPGRPESEESPEKSPGRSFSQLQPVQPAITSDSPASPSPPKKLITLRSGMQVKTTAVVLGTGGKVRKIYVKAAPKVTTGEPLPPPPPPVVAPPPQHTCQHCRRSFQRADHLQQHLAAYHAAEEEAVIDVTTAESPEKLDVGGFDASATAEVADSSVSSLNWEELAGKKVNYPIALKKIPIGKRTSGKFWRTPTLKSGLPLVLKVVGGSGMEELSEAQKPLFCSACRFLFKSAREMREHVVTHHLDLTKAAEAAQPAPVTAAVAVAEPDSFGEAEDAVAAEAIAENTTIAAPSPRKSPRIAKEAKEEVVPTTPAVVVHAAPTEPTPPAAPAPSGVIVTGSGGVKLRFNCEQCEIEFKSRENVVEHLRTVHGLKMMWQCARCDFFTPTKAALGRHEAAHAKDAGPSAYTCEYCGKSFVYESYLRRHRSSHTGDKFYACPTCGQNFKSQGRLVVHKATAHEGGGGLSSLYQCPKCSKTFPYKSYLDRHVKTHISDVPKACPHCQQVFQVESSLRKHIVKEHEGSGLLSCPHCDKKFLYPSYLVRHQTVHTNAREHQCPMCNKQFSLRGTLLDHLKSHLPSSDDVLPKSSTCEICHNKYRHESNLERHMQTMHPREWLDSLYDTVPDARFEEEVVTAPEEEEVRVELIDQPDPHEYPAHEPL